MCSILFIYENKSAIFVPEANFSTLARNSAFAPATLQTDPPSSLSEPAETLPAPPGSFHLLCPREDQATEHALCGQWQGPSGASQGHDCGGVWVPLTEPAEC